MEFGKPSLWLGLNYYRPQNVGVLLKPNYSKKQRFFNIIFTYLRYYTSPKWPWSTGQASTVHFRHGTSLLSGHFGPVYLLQVVKMIMKNIAF